MQDITLVVPSIGCQGCIKKIVNKLQTLPGIEVVGTDVAAQSLSLRYVTEEVSSEEIEHAVREIGHRVAKPETD